MRVPVLGVGVVALGVVGFLVLSPKPNANTAERTAARTAERSRADAVARLEQEVASLRSEVARSQVFALAATSAATRMASAQPVPAGAVREVGSDHQDGSVAQKPAGPSHEQALAFLGDKFAAEEKDPAWASGAEASAREIFGKLLPANSVIQSVECHSRICKVSLLYGDEAAYEKALETMSHPGPDYWRGIVTYAPPERRHDGGVRVDEYLFREGENPLGEIYADASTGSSVSE